MKTQTKPKPWGKEIWFAQTDAYAGKILIIKKGHRYSLQYHKTKSETQYVLSGKVKMTIGQSEDKLEDVILSPGDKLDITPGMIHRAEGLEDSEIFEVSTPELDDVVKLEDDYGRSGEGNDEETDRQLAKGSSEKCSFGTKFTPICAKEAKREEGVSGSDTSTSDKPPAAKLDKLQSEVHFSEDPKQE